MKEQSDLLEFVKAISDMTAIGNINARSIIRPGVTIKRAAMDLVRKYDHIEARAAKRNAKLPRKK